MVYMMQTSWVESAACSHPGFKANYLIWTSWTALRCVCEQGLIFSSRLLDSGTCLLRPLPSANPCHVNTIFLPTNLFLFRIFTDFPQTSWQLLSARKLQHIDRKSNFLFYFHKGFFILSFIWLSLRWQDTCSVRTLVWMQRCPLKTDTAG